MEVCVTGATGFIGGHIVKQLLERGYKVRATTRSLDQNQASKWEFLKQLPHADQNLQLFEADLLKPGAFDHIIRGCVYVFHAAAVVSSGTSNPERDVVRPAVEGTRNVLSSCLKAGTVRHVVVTSSIAAICEKGESQQLHTEEEWNTTSTIDTYPYGYAKTKSEQLVWETAKNQSGPNKIHFTTILPSFSVGPIIHKNISSSAELVDSFLLGKLPGKLPTYNTVTVKKDLQNDGRIPNVSFQLVDIRDVAKAHILAVEKPEVTDGQRYILYTQTMWLKEVAAILKQNFPEYPVPTMRAPDWMVILSQWSRRQWIRQILGIYDDQWSNEKVKRDLKIDLIPIKTSLIDAGNSYRQLGIKPKSRFSLTSVAMATIVGVGALAAAWYYYPLLEDLSHRHGYLLFK